MSNGLLSVETKSRQTGGEREWERKWSTPTPHKHTHTHMDTHMHGSRPEAADTVVGLVHDLVGNSPVAITERCHRVNVIELAMNEYHLLLRLVRVLFTGMGQLCNYSYYRRKPRDLKMFNSVNPHIQARLFLRTSCRNVILCMSSHDMRLASDFSKIIWFWIEYLNFHVFIKCTAAYPDVCVYPVKQQIEFSWKYVRRPWQENFLK